jgi:hypothetical protein
MEVRKISRTIGNRKFTGTHAIANSGKHYFDYPYARKIGKDLNINNAMQIAGDIQGLSVGYVLNVLNGTVWNEEVILRAENIVNSLAQ